jgi:hypothetical protein
MILIVTRINFMVFRVLELFNLRGTLTMVAVCSPETLTTIYQISRYHNPEHYNLNARLLEISFRGSNPGGCEILRARPDRSWGLPSTWTMGTLSLKRGYSGRDVALTTHPHLAPRLKKVYSYTSFSPLGLHGLL